MPIGCSAVGAGRRTSRGRDGEGSGGAASVDVVSAGRSDVSGSASAGSVTGTDVSGGVPFRTISVFIVSAGAGTVADGSDSAGRAPGSVPSGTCLSGFSLRDGARNSCLSGGGSGRCDGAPGTCASVPRGAMEAMETESASARKYVDAAKSDSVERACPNLRIIAAGSFATTEAGEASHAETRGHGAFLAEEFEPCEELRPTRIERINVSVPPRLRASVREASSQSQLEPVRSVPRTPTTRGGRSRRSPARSRGRPVP